MRKFIAHKNLRQLINEQRWKEDMCINAILNHRNRFMRCPEFAEKYMNLLSKARALSDLYRAVLQKKRAESKRQKQTEGKASNA